MGSEAKVPLDVSMKGFEVILFVISVVQIMSKPGGAAFMAAF